jgi:hypothetical protein
MTVQITAETDGVDGGRMNERRNDRVARHETTASQRDQLPNWHAVASDHERLALIKSAHDLTALVAELSLGDRFGHALIVARVRHGSRRDEVTTAARNPLVTPPPRPRTSAVTGVNDAEPVALRVAQNDEVRIGRVVP